MSLSRLRVALLLAVAGLLAGAVAAVHDWSSQRLAMHDKAVAMLGVVERQLDAVAHEIAFLEQPATGDGCTPEQMRRLLEASLASARVQRFRQGQRGADFACGPGGPGSPLVIPSELGTGLMLDSTAQIGNRLVASMAGPGGWVTQAELDSRVFDRPADSGLLAELPHRISLLTASGRRLAVWSVPEADDQQAQWGAPALKAVQLSPRHGVAVAVEVAPAPRWSHALARAAWAASAALLLAATITAWVWRRAVLRARLRSRIARALRRRQFEPHVQPIVELGSGRCVGGEVLMRWHHPERGVLPPAEFIEEAERTGQIVAMSDLVMVLAAQRLSQLASLQPQLYFSFNVTPQQLRQPCFAKRLDEIFTADTLPRAQVLLELTEREFVDQVTRRALEALRQAGWRIAIDDFGTGQSSLASLEQLPVDRIKIDRAFVRTIEEQTVSRPVLDAILALARGLGIRLIAEGVETRAQWDYLRRNGVDCAQGYLFAKPMTVDAFVRWHWHRSDAAGAATAPPDAQPAFLPGDIDPLVVDAQARQLWQRMKTAGGLDVRTRLHGLRSYPDCFVGREAVDWLVRHQRVSREQAVRLGRRLMALGLIRHVVNEHDFKDEELFYRLTGQADPAAHAEAVAGLADALRGPDGPRWRDRARGLLMHRACACGQEIVGWIAERHAVPRETAAQWAAQLMRQGVLRHVFDDQPLRDDRSLYRLG